MKIKPITIEEKKPAVIILVINHMELFMWTLYGALAIVLAHIISSLLDALFVDSAKAKIAEKMA